MATKVTKSQEIELQDGTKLTVRPLNIKGLRKFMEVVKGFADVDDDVDGLDLMVDAVAIALKSDYSEIADDRDYLEENLDMDNINTIMSVAGGVDMSGGDVDPNLVKG